jgi:acyl-CoA synthetase (NDP forming)
VAPLADSTRSRLASFLPASASVTNPVDMIASATPDQFRRAVETVLGDTEVDSAIVIFIAVGGPTAEEVARAVGEGVAAARAAGAKSKPVLACIMADARRAREPAAEGERIPIYAFPESAGRALGKISAYAEWRAAPAGVIPDFGDIDPARAREICEKALREGGAGWLSPDETRAVLEATGLSLPPGGTAGTADEAVRLARAIGFPVAVKLASRSLVHKTEIGGVRLNLPDESSVRRAFEEIRSRLAQEGKPDAMGGVTVQPMIPAGVEVMVGVTADPLFGPLIAFGLGGIHVEILADVRFRITPLTDRDAAEMVREIRGYRLLEGYRGHPPGDVAAIQNVLLRVSRLVEEVPEIAELDLNPLFALPPGKGCAIADARIRVAAPKQESR